MSHTTQCTNPFRLEKQNKIPARYWLIRSYINRWYKMAEDGRGVIPILRMKDNSPGIFKAESIVGIHTVLG